MKVLIYTGTVIPFQLDTCTFLSEYCSFKKGDLDGLHYLKSFKVALQGSIYKKILFFVRMVRD